MERASRLAPLLVTCLTLLLLTTCGKDSPTKPTPPVPARILISPSTATLTSIGQTIQLTATVVDQADSAIPGATVVWASSDTSIAPVSAEGVVTARKNGSTRITATSGGVSESAAITVSQLVAKNHHITILSNVDHGTTHNPTRGHGTGSERYACYGGDPGLGKQRHFGCRSGRRWSGHRT